MAKLNWKEAAGVALVVIILAGLPATLWEWREHALKNPAGAKVVVLTAVAKGGVWTQDDVVGWNYWWKNPTPVKDIPLQQGDRVYVRLRSADVLHSFGIPLLHIGPVEIPAGHTVGLEFRADRPGTLTFLCWQVCSPQHQNLRGRFVVAGNGDSADSW